MRRISATAFGAALALTFGTQASPVLAEKPVNPKGSDVAKPEKAPTSPKSSVGPRSGAGSRKVTNVARAAEPEAPAANGSKTDPPKPAKADKPSHKVGRAPKKPSSTLPKGAARSTPNHAARRQVAGGATADDIRAGKDDPELRALNEADRVLFPKPLFGASVGWSWDLPKPRKKRTTVVASGLPPTGTDVTPKDRGALLEKAEWLRSLTMPNLPVRMDARVVKYLEFYRDTRRGKAIARVWAKKSGRFVATIQAELARAGLPTDLVWLSLIESGHNPSIHSHAGAAGLWQFIPEAGQLYGLTVDRWVDERLDPQRATGAAIGYLGDLHKRFGSWDLAMAAYNMGYGGMGRAIRKFNTNDFWELSRHEAGIPWETTLYVPKILAIAIVMNNKKAFGISDVVQDAPESFDTVRAPAGVTLAQVAQASETPIEVIVRANAHLLSKRTPPQVGKTPSKFRVYVPRGKGVTAERKLATARSNGDYVPYVVRFGDSANVVASEHGTSVGRLRRINALTRRERLIAGTVLLVPRAKTAAAPTPPEKEVVIVPARQFQYPNRRRIFYEVRSGDTTGDVGQAFDVTVAQLALWNSIDRSAKLVGGMVLQMYVPADANLSQTRYTDAKDANVLVAGTDEFFDHFEGLKGRRRIRIVAKEGDTLRTIGKRYGLTAGSMERINRVSRYTKLEPGTKVIVYARIAAAKDAPSVGAVSGRPLPPVTPPKPDALPAVAKNP